MKLPDEIKAVLDGESEGCIVQGDCIEVMATMPDGCVGGAVTSPPYAEQRKDQYGGIPEADYPAWTSEWVSNALRVSVSGASVLLNIREHVANGQLSDYVHKTRLAVRDSGIIEVDELIWVKPDSPPMGNNARPRRSWERILWFSLSRQPFCDAKTFGRKTDRLGFMASGEDKDWISGYSPHKPGLSRRPDFASVWVCENVETGHPAAYPVCLARWMASLISKPTDIILDPFCGSGTTCVAAKKLGRRYIGIELSEKYCRIARNRVKNTERPLFTGGGE
jgi:site-specific DNA-methyltransferase (adenine-specific)